MPAVSQAQIAWFAGVFEGEGSIYVRRFVRGKAKTEHFHGGLRLQMTDEDVVRRIHQITGVGSVVSCRPTGLGSKRSWAWQVQDRAGFEIAVEMLRPYLGERRSAKLVEVEAKLTWKPGWWRAASASG